MIVSFDFDSTLDQEWVQNIAKIFINSGCEVHITTSRCSGMSNNDLETVAKELGITKINFTEGALKSETLKLIQANIHFDDMEDEVDSINRDTNCNALLVGFDISFINYLFKK
jgi:hypothetical protein